MKEQNNGRQNTKQKTKDWTTQIQIHTGGGGWGGIKGPACPLLMVKIWWKVKSVDNLWTRKEGENYVFLPQLILKRKTKYATVEIFPKSIRKIVERWTNDSLNTQIHDHKR
jgi:hypothetical protein